MFQATGGVVRLVNQVCDHALLLAYVAGRRTIEPAGIEEAWADLQQLPAPSGTQPAGETAGGGVIEFGSLDDASCGAGTGAMPMLAMGMADAGEDGDVPTASVGMAPATAPAMASVFRVARIEDEETPPDDSEPGAQIHRIEQLLAVAEEDFQPAGSIGPEVELCFEEAIHPFREEFEHEEVVSDRYAAVKRVEAATCRSVDAASCRVPPEAATAPPPAASLHGGLDAARCRVYGSDAARTHAHERWGGGRAVTGGDDGRRWGGS